MISWAIKYRDTAKDVLVSIACFAVVMILALIGWGISLVF